MSTTRSRPRQLPVLDVPSRGAQVAQGMLAVVGMLLIVVGVPVALWSAFGAPWPTEAPNASWLTARFEVGTVMSVLAVLVWLAWAHFCLCLVVEAVHERGVRGLAPRVPGGGLGTQALARRIVASIVLLVGTASVTMPAASAAGTGAERPVPSSYSTASLAPVMDSAIEAVDDLPTMDELTRATKADVAAQVDGVVTYYDVKPPDGRNYDTLWDIAERYLGDGFRYKELYRMNKGETQPDGRKLTEPDLIHPGWVLQMPNDAKGPGLKVVESGLRGPVPDAPAAPVTPAPAPVPDLPEPDTAAMSDSVADQTWLATWAPVFGVAGGLVAGGIALRLRRQHAALSTAQLWALRGRRADGHPDPDGPGGPPPGSRLRDEAQADSASWLDRALRGLGVRGAGPTPAPNRCAVADSGVVLTFTEPPASMPAGWEPDADDRVWRLSREAALDLDPAAVAPLPGLVAVGRRDDGSALLLDLESAPGPMSLGGDPEVARGLALSIALDTATHPWADRRLVTMVGFADDVTAVAPESVRQVDDLGRVLDSLENVARDQRSACRRADTFSARQARIDSGDWAAWTYQLVVLSGLPRTDELDRLCELAGDQQVSLGVVVVGDTPLGALRFAALPNGRLTASYLGIDVEAQQLGIEGCQVVGDLVPSTDGAAPRVELDVLAEALGDDAPVEAAEPAVTVRLMGPLEVDGVDAPDPVRSPLWTELVAYVALHPEGVHVNRLTSAIWPRGIDDDVRDATLDAVQQWLGAGEDGAPRLVRQDGIVTLDHQQVAVDWDRFRAALNRAAACAPVARVQVLQEALRLVRGRAWQDLPDGRYGWLASGTYETDLPLAVGLTARVVAESSARTDDGETARDALQQGLRMSPASEELWRAALRLADRFGGRGDVRAVADQMYAAVAEHGSPRGASAQTDALVDELLPGYRPHAA